MQQQPANAIKLNIRLFFVSVSVLMMTSCIIETRRQTKISKYFTCLIIGLDLNQFFETFFQ